MPEKKPRQPRTYARGETSHIIDVQRRLGLSNADMSRALGYSSNALADWVASGSCPATAVLAAEALDRRSTAERRYLMTVSGNGAVLSTTELPLDLDELTLGGRTYILLPKD